VPRCSPVSSRKPSSQSRRRKNPIARNRLQSPSANRTTDTFQTTRAAQWPAPHVVALVVVAGPRPRPFLPKPRPLRARGRRGQWLRSCYARSTPTPLDPHTVQILAEAYELTTLDVVLDSEIIQALPWSGLDLLVWLCRRHDWHASLAVNYLAAIKREIRVVKAPSSTHER
jgi:hypothetical protein